MFQKLPCSFEIYLLWKEKQNLNGSYDTGFNPTGFGLKHYWHTLTTVSYVIFQKISLYFTLASPHVVLNLGS